MVSLCLKYVSARQSGAVSGSDKDKIFQDPKLDYGTVDESAQKQEITHPDIRRRISGQYVTVKNNYSLSTLSSIYHTYTHTHLSKDQLYEWPLTDG